MYCPQCGKQVDVGDNYCANCGSILKASETRMMPEILNNSEAKLAKSTVESRKRTYTSKEEVFSLRSKCLLAFSVIALIGVLAATIIPNIAGQKEDPKAWFGISLWMGIIATIYGRKHGKSGWLWFFYGFISGLGAYFLLVTVFYLAAEF